MVGRNDPCPCGSGKKYKKCCMNSNEPKYAKSAIEQIIAESPFPSNINDVLLKLFRYMESRGIHGACYAFNSVLYVALSELGYSPQLCYGEVGNHLNAINHCWIELDEMILDASYHVSYLHRLQEKHRTLTPTIDAQDIENLKHPNHEYGIVRHGLNIDSEDFAKSPFVQYMDGYKKEKNGLWGVLSEVMPAPITNFDSLREKYTYVNRIYKH